MRVDAAPELRQVPVPLCLRGDARCASCPLFDPERAIRDSIGEFPAPGIVIELGPALRALLRGDPVPPDEEEAVDAEVPDFVPEDWDRGRRIRSANPRL